MKKRTEPTEPISSINAYATETGLDSRTVKRRLLLAGVEPVSRAGRGARYRLADIVRAMLAGEAESAGEVDADSPRARLLTAQARKVEFQLSVLRKEYVLTEDMQRWIAEMVGEAKQILLSGPPSLAPQVVGLAVPEAEKLIRDWVLLSLGKLSGGQSDSNALPGTANDSSAERPTHQPTSTECV